MTERQNLKALEMVVETYVYELRAQDAQMVDADILQLSVRVNTRIVTNRVRAQSIVKGNSWS